MGNPPNKSIIFTGGENVCFTGINFELSLLRKSLLSERFYHDDAAHSLCVENSASPMTTFAKVNFH